MKNLKPVTILTLLTVLFSLISTVSGITSTTGIGEHKFQSVHHQEITLYGRGLYQYMSKGTAIQAIAQDYVTLLVGVPLLLIGLYLTRKGSLRGKFLLAGTLLYFLTTYMYNIASISYNTMFLSYVAITSVSFYAFALTMLSFDLEKLPLYFDNKLKRKFVGGFLIVGAIGTGFGWIPVVLTPLLKGAIPMELEHYTSLVTSGYDLAIFLPISFLSGWLLIKRTAFGYLLSTVYIIFLSILMTTITSKLVSVYLAGVPMRIQQLYSFPIINLISILCTIFVLKSVKNTSNK